MKIIIDGNTYNFDEQYYIKKAKKTLQEKAESKIELKNGPTIDLSSNSILNVLIRQLLVFVLPIVTWSAEKIGVNLPKKNKHDSIVKYIINSYFKIMENTLEDSSLELVIDNGEVTDFKFDKNNTFIASLLSRKTGN